MKLIKCQIHFEEFRLPTTEEEFVSGNLHGQIEHLSEHHERFPKCRFEEVKN